MTSHLRNSDHIDSATAYHPPPPPPAEWQRDDNPDTSPPIRVMCSFGGRILPRPHDNQLRYVGGDTRIVAIPRGSTFSTLLSKLTKFTSTEDFTVKYQLPNEDLDALISVSSDEDIENMMEEYDRLLPQGGNSTNSAVRTPRLRMFLFPVDDGNNGGGGGSIGGGFGSILSGSGASKHENWFVDALNGLKLERNRSEASSILSEVPDYLFGLDNTSDDQPIKSKTNVSISDPGSPAPVVSSPIYGSNSSVQSVPTFETIKSVEPDVNSNPNPPVWQYVNEPVPVYYMPGPVQGAMPPVQLPMQYVQHQYRPVYIGGPPPAMGRAYDYVAGPTAAVMPEAKNIPGVIPIYRPTMMGVHPGISE